MKRKSRMRGFRRIFVSSGGSDTETNEIRCRVRYYGLFGNRGPFATSESTRQL
jgi:hypothetical protein